MRLAAEILAVGEARACRSRTSCRTLRAISTRSPAFGGCAGASRSVSARRPKRRSPPRARCSGRSASAAGRTHKHWPRWTPQPPPPPSPPATATTRASPASAPPCRPGTSCRRARRGSRARSARPPPASSSAAGPRSSASNAVALHRDVAELAPRQRPATSPSGSSQSTRNSRTAAPSHRPAREIGAADRVAGQRARHVERRGLEAVRQRDRRRQHARRGAIDAGPSIVEVAVVGREADRHAVPPLQPPAKGDRRRASRSRKLGIIASRISISGTDGASPAANVARLRLSRSSAKRTGTSNRNPARTSAPAAGGVVEADDAVAGSASSPPPFPRPPTDTRTAPATGRVIRRTCPP